MAGQHPGRVPECERSRSRNGSAWARRAALHRRDGRGQGGSTVGAFGSSKFALRGLAQSLARDLGPKGIHVAWINVDGSIDIPGRERRPQQKDEDLLKPDAIAETYWHLAHQDRSAWTQELEVRPFKEKF